MRFKNQALKKYGIDWAGRHFSVEIGRVAKQANASVLVQYGETVVLVTAVMGKDPREAIDYFPLMVDYEERLYAAGKIKGSRFIKREGRPSDEAILTSRLVDRALRPLFPDGLYNDVQIVLTVLSFDDENDPDIPALVGASLALSISDIPWHGPIAGIRVGMIRDEWVLNPTYKALQESAFDLVVAGTRDRVVMLEAGMHEIAEEKVYEAIVFAQKHMEPMVAFVGGIAKEIGAQKQVVSAVSVVEEGSEEKNAGGWEEVQAAARAFFQQHKRAYIFETPKATKFERKEMYVELAERLDAHLVAQNVGKEKRKKARGLLQGWIEYEVTQAILQEERRLDNRALTDIRDVSCSVGLLPRTHGSALFNRGDTQVLSIVTLGSPGSEQTLDDMEISGKKRYMHHYNFPPFSVGEAGPLRGPGRREIGHGALAERALVPVLPEKEQFPYTIRVVSEVLGSNGSSSMGSTCGSSLALMDAGVPIKKSVAGIAMGLASEDQGHFRVLTDLQDLEDGKGGMDFKIAGTYDGITAIQMDTKTNGLTPDMVQQALFQGRDARVKILEIMAETIREPRPDLSPHAPRIYTLRIDPAMIRFVIGPGGKTINEIIDKTGVAIDIEPDGLVMITAEDEASANEAIATVEHLTRVVKVGDVVEGRVTRVMDFGAFVELTPHQEGMVHVSKLSNDYIGNIHDVVKIGDVLKVKVAEIDEQGRINLVVDGVDRLYQGGNTGRGDQGQRSDSRRRPPRAGFGAHGRPPHRGPRHQRPNDHFRDY